MFVKSGEGLVKFDPEHMGLLRRGFDELRPANKEALFGAVVSFADFTPENRTILAMIMTDILGVDQRDKDYSLTDAL